MGKYLFVDTGGAQPERVIQELTWERVANLQGMPGHNIALDLLNEFLNNDFKGYNTLTLPFMCYIALFCKAVVPDGNDEKISIQSF